MFGLEPEPLILPIFLSHWDWKLQALPEIGARCREEARDAAKIFLRSGVLFQEESGPLLGSEVFMPKFFFVKGSTQNLY